MRFLTAVAIAGLCTFWGFSEVRAEHSCGTSIDFVKNRHEAAKQALKQEKLLFMLHVSGLFEDPNLT